MFHDKKVTKLIFDGNDHENYACRKIREILNKGAQCSNARDLSGSIS